MQVRRFSMRALLNRLWSPRRHCQGRSARFLPRIESMEERTLMSAGAIDATFGMAGKAHYSLTAPAAESKARAMALQADGKIVLAGYSPGPMNFDFSVARLNADGSLDTSFGAGKGYVTIPFDRGGDNEDRANAVAVQSWDGKIVVAGFAETDVGQFAFAVARLNADGTSDNLFGANGKETVPLPTGDAEATAIKLQSDHKIVLAGFDTTTVGGVSTYDFAVTRLNPDFGDQDTTFNPAAPGYTLIPFTLGGTNDAKANAVDLQSDGKIVVAGSAVNGLDSSAFAAARLTSGGTLDTTFNATGKTTLTFNPGGADQANAVAVQADGKIVLAGSAGLSAASAAFNFGVARLNANGSPDTAFNGTGKTTVSFGAGALDTSEANAVALQADGKIVAAGHSSPGGAGSKDPASDFAVARLTTDGKPDASFNGGHVTVGFTLSASNNADVARGVAIQPDGRIIVAGSVETAHNVDDFAVVRLQGDKAPVPVAASKLFAVAGAGRVEVRTIAGNTKVADFRPYGAGYTGGISTAFGDVNGDGVPDLIVGGINGPHNVLVYDGRALMAGTFQPDGASLLIQWAPYDAAFNVGEYVAAGDVSNNGFADIITGASIGNPNVRIWSGRDIAKNTFNPTGASKLRDFFPYQINFNVGTTVAAWDFNGDGYADVVTGALPGNPHVRIFDGKTLAQGPFDFNEFNNANADQLANTGFFPFKLNFDVGAYVAAGDIYGDGGDLIVGSSQGNPEVRVYRNADIRNRNFDPQSAAPANTFFANALGQNVGATVGVGKFEGDSQPADILIGAVNGPSHWRVVKGTTNGGSNPPAAVAGLEGDFAGGSGSLFVGS